MEEAMCEFFGKRLNDCAKSWMIPDKKITKISEKCTDVLTKGSNFSASHS